MSNIELLMAAKTVIRTLITNNNPCGSFLQINRHALAQLTMAVEHEERMMEREAMWNEYQYDNAQQEYHMEMIE